MLGVLVVVFRPQSRRRIGLELGLTRDNAHIVARFNGPSSQGGQHSMSTVSRG